MQFFDDGSARLNAILCNEDIDLVAVEWASRPEFARLVLVIVALDDEYADVFDQIGANRLDVLHHPLNVVEGSFRILDQLVDRVFRRIAVELTRFIAPLLLPLRDLVNNMLEVLLQCLDLSL